MLTVVTSGKAAPGVSTTVWALALGWPAALLVADCDPAGGDLAPGYLGGRVAIDRSVLTWATATRRSHINDATSQLTGHVITVDEQPTEAGGGQKWLLPGVHNPSQGASLAAGGWQRLASSLAQAQAAFGRDVLVDAGRLGPASPMPLLPNADRVLLTVRPTIRSVHCARVAAAQLVEELGDLTRVAAVVVGDGPYPPAEVAASLGVPLAAHLPADPAAAAALSDGLTAGVRNLGKTKLVRAARELAMQLQGSAGASPGFAPHEVAASPTMAGGMPR